MLLSMLLFCFIRHFKLNLSIMIINILFFLILFEQPNEQPKEQPN